MERYFGEKTPKLGFGLMRLPRNADGTIDVPQTSEMVDLFLAAGLTYFDTAYVYGGSEEAARKALVERYPRESYTLATKLNVHAQGCVDAATARKQLETSLERTGAEYFDYYLLHAVGEGNIGDYDAYGIWDFVKEMKEKGLIRHWGFSFHGSTGLLERVLTEHPDSEFVQLQINYADWENPNVNSRINYETARRHGKSIVVMEPVKGGMLAAPPRRVAEILRTADPDASPASWAIRYVASMDGILTVLSGMSNVAQMKDNLSCMADFKPLSEAEQETVRQAREAISQVESIPCTGCNYCGPGCPMGIRIPRIFSARNTELIWENKEKARQEYGRAVQDAGTASACIACGQCESQCPQHIGIIEELKKCAERYDV